MSTQPNVTELASLPQPEDSSYHIEATESLVERTLRTLKHNDLFAVFDQQGNFAGGADGPDGLFFKDTRFVSKLLLTLGGTEPLQLSSVLLDDNGAMVVDLTNADLHADSGRVWLHRDTVHLSRFKFLSNSTGYERLRLRAYNPIGRAVPVDLAFDCDFADLFEVRGQRRPARGVRRVRAVDGDRVQFEYQGLDKVVRRTTLIFDPAPTALTENSAHWQVDLDANPDQSIVIKACCQVDGGGLSAPHIARAFRQSRETRSGVRRARAQVTSSNAQFDAMIGRAWSDIDMLTTETPTGLYPYAGVPWYSTIFGRDGIITALQMLWCAPYIARGVLKTLAAHQATAIDADSDAQPGKILHEMRGGEMAGLGEVPFGHYYGTVDATPLFVMLAARYAARTGDIDLVRAIWPNIVAALGWMDQYGDVDGDGFLEYARMTEAGLSNQGWKDSSDSIFHRDGRLANGPIALSEVQAYAYEARLGAAALARVMGDEGAAQGWREDANRLRQRFEEQFWVEDLQYYALALDGEKRPCGVLASNAGHGLLCGIVDPERARCVAETIVSPRFFSGWGVRTIAVGEARYNPMSYHNGSVWPHDNALIALGLARYGHKNAVNTIFEGMFAAATYDEFRRLPELFCGFNRRRRCAPTSYPVACSPQAWAAATPFALIKAALGLKIDHAGASIELTKPSLPRFLDELRISDLAVGEGSVDLLIGRTERDVTTAVVKRSGEIAVSIHK